MASSDGSNRWNGRRDRQLTNFGSLKGYGYQWSPYGKGSRSRLTAALLRLPYCSYTTQSFSESLVADRGCDGSHPLRGPSLDELPRRRKVLRVDLRRTSVHPGNDREAGCGARSAATSMRPRAR